jgi:type I restriction enzyme S subunit
MNADDVTLPDGWSTTTIESLAEPKGIGYGVLKPGSQIADGVPMLRVTDIHDGNVDQSSLYHIDRALDIEFQRTKLRGGEVVLSIQGSVGRAAVVPHDLAGANISRTLAMIRLLDPSLAPWVYRALESPHVQHAMRQVVGGTTRDSLNLRDLRQLKIPLAPDRERSKILDLVDKTEVLRQSSSQHATLARRAVNRFRQAILTAGCSGRLTADWREQRDIPAVSELLAELRVARQETKARRTSVHLPSADELDELPITWDWAVVGEIGEVQLGGTPSRKEAAYWNGGVPWVSSGEVANCRISSTRETITEAGLSNSSAKLYPAGTVLIAMIGEGKTRGQAAILDIEASTNQNAAGVVSDRDIVNPEYLWRWALAQYEVTRAVGRGGNQPALNGQKVRELTIPVPPLEEQREIVRRVDQLLALADGLTRRIEIASTRVDRSSQAVLARAFRGELGLVTEEKADELRAL